MSLWADSLAHYALAADGRARAQRAHPPETNASASVSSWSADRDIMHAEAYRFVQSALGALAPRRSVLEIGSRHINGTVRGLFNGADYVGIDLAHGPCVDVVADGATFTPEAPIDTVVCCEVLEHTDAAKAIVAHGLSLLPPDGILLVTCAAPDRAPHSAVDGNGLRPGEFYRNVLPNDLHAWVLAAGAEVTILAHDQGRGDVYLCARKA